MAKRLSRLGWNWCGIPRLGPHALRTYHIFVAVNSAIVQPSDYPALASCLQVSVDTLTAVYVAPSLRSPQAQLALRLHGERAQDVVARIRAGAKSPVAEALPVAVPVLAESTTLQAQMAAQHAAQQAAQARQFKEQMELLATVTTHAAPVREAAASVNKLYGPALGILRRKRYAADVGSYLRARITPAAIETLKSRPRYTPASAFKTLCDEAFADLCSQRTSGSLPAEHWFNEQATRFEDSHSQQFLNFVRKVKLQDAILSSCDLSP